MAYWGGVIFCLFLFTQNKIFSQEECDPWTTFENIRWEETFRCHSFDVTHIYNDQDLSSIVNNGFITNKCFVIHDATLTLDMFAIISNCRFFMDGLESKIVVGNGITASIISSKFKGSNSLWGGIEIKNEATFRFSNNTINDAIIAIQNLDFEPQEASCQVIINNNYFNRNLFGVIFRNFDGFEEDIDIMMSKNYFNCTSELKPGYGGKKYGYSNIAILVNYVEFISNNTNPCNASYIANHSNGILAYNSDLRLRNYYFENIKARKEDYFYSEDEGNAIAVNKTSVGKDLITPIDYYGTSIINGFGSKDILVPTMTTMKNVDYGITVKKNTHTEIIQHKFEEGVTRGIKASQIIKRLDINDNYFSTFGLRGIVVEQLKGTDVDITTNRLYRFNSIQSLREKLGITLNNCFASPETGMVVSNNLVYSNSITYAIDLNNTDGLLIEDNEVYSTPISFPSYHVGTIGIRLKDGFNNIIHGNYLYQSFEHEQGGIDGIQLIASPSTELSCNRIYDYDRGLSIYDDNSNSDIIGNRYDGNRTGIYYGFNSLTGNQLWASNRWFGDFTNGYRILNSFNSELKFWVNIPDINTEFDPRPCLPSDLAVFNSYNRYYDCSELPLDKSPKDTSLTESDSLVAINQNTFTGYPTEEQWIQDFNLYKKIQEFNIPVNQGTVYDTFMVESGSNGIADSYSAEKQLLEALEVDSAYNYQMEFIVEELDSLYNLVSNYNNQYINGNISDATYFNLRSTIKSAIKAQQYNLRQISVAHENQKNTELNSLFSGIIQGLPTGNTASMTFKAYLRLSAKFYSDQLTSADSADILSYDDYCLEEYKNGLLGIQSLAALLGSSEDVVYDCSPPPQERSRRENEIQWTISPNPVQGNYLILRGNRLRSGQLSMLSSSGKVIYRRSFKDKKQLLLPTDKVAAGVYFIRIVSKNGEWTGKAIINQ